MSLSRSTLNLGGAIQPLAPCFGFSFDISHWLLTPRSDIFQGPLFPLQSILPQSHFHWHQSYLLLESRISQGLPILLMPILHWYFFSSFEYEQFSCEYLKYQRFWSICYSVYISCIPHALCSYVLLVLFLSLTCEYKYHS